MYDALAIQALEDLNAGSLLVRCASIFQKFREDVDPDIGNIWDDALRSG
jgi:hypothetical protein